MLNRRRPSSLAAVVSILAIVPGGFLAGWFNVPPVVSALGLGAVALWVWWLEIGSVS